MIRTVEQKMRGASKQKSAVTCKDRPTLPLFLPQHHMNANPTMAINMMALCFEMRTFVGD